MMTSTAILSFLPRLPLSFPPFTFFSLFCLSFVPHSQSSFSIVVLFFNGSQCENANCSNIGIWEKKIWGRGVDLTTKGYKGERFFLYASKLSCQWVDYWQFDCQWTSKNVYYWIVERFCSTSRPLIRALPKKEIRLHYSQVVWSC